MSEPRSPSESVRNAVVDAARALSAADPRAHVFFEDRADVRMNLGSSGNREIVSTRSRGGTIAGRRSIHDTEPGFLRGHANALDRGSDAPVSPKGIYQNWVAGLESVIVAAAAGVCRGRRHPYWSAQLVSFHQEVWVASPGRMFAHDIRQGCRLELRVWAAAGSGEPAVEELVLRPTGRTPVVESFSRALARAEVRGAIGASPRPGSTTAVFAPGVAGVIAHELIGHALEGDTVARGRTWLRPGLDLTAGRPVTVIDDPRRGRGAWTLDDEGIAPRETLLIDGGRSVGTLLDKSSAAVLRVASTGHGRRSSYLDAVHPRMGCTFIVSGSDEPDEVLRSTAEGVFIRRMVAGQTDPLTGRATFVVTDADRIVEGRIAEPIELFVLELDGVEAWRSIDRVAHDLAFDTCIGSCVRDGQPMAVSVGAPTIRIGVATVRS